MTPEQLAEIEARAAAATPGPWEARERVLGGNGRNDCEIAGFVHKGWATPVCKLYPGFVWYEGDKAFITHARQDIPALCAEVRRLQNGIAKIEARWREASEDKTFRTHYRETMAECAHELRDLLAGSVDEDELEAEINKTIDEDEPLTRDQMPWFRENMR